MSMPNPFAPNARWAAGLVLLLMAFPFPACAAPPAFQVLYRPVGNRVRYLLFLDRPCPLNLAARARWRRATEPGTPYTAVGCWTVTPGATQFSKGRNYRLPNALIVMPAGAPGRYTQQEEPMLRSLWHYGWVTADGKLSEAPWPESVLRLFNPVPVPALGR